MVSISGHRLRRPMKPKRYIVETLDKKTKAKLDKLLKPKKVEKKDEEGKDKPLNDVNKNKKSDSIQTNTPENR
eukprot:UN01206